MYVAEGRPCEKLEPEQTLQEGLFSVEASSWSQGPGQQGSRCGTLVSPQALLFQAFISESFFDVHQSPSLCSGSIEVFLALTYWHWCKSGSLGSWASLLPNPSASSRKPPASEQNLPIWLMLRLRVVKASGHSSGCQKCPPPSPFWKGLLKDSGYPYSLEHLYFSDALCAPWVVRHPTKAFCSSL